MASPADVRNKVAALPWDAVLALYAEMLRAQPDATGMLARVLRDKARAGEVPVEAVPVLTVCLVDAPNPEALSQLAKALAAFGRDARVAAAPLRDRMVSLAVGSDEAFWALDGCIHALSYLGGPAALSGVDALEARGAGQVRARGVYKGALAAQERESLMADSLREARARLALPDPGPRWMAKSTSREAVESAPARKTAPWMTRGG
jgi:hypothetical protein